MSPELQEFYNSYQAWLDNGALDGNPYSRRDGLCHAIHLFVNRKHEHGENPWFSQNIMREFLCGEMQEQFMRDLSEDDGYPELIAVYPFGLATTYSAEKVRATAHLNLKRRAWVRKHATNVKEQAK